MNLKTSLTLAAGIAMGYFANQFLSGPNIQPAEHSGAAGPNSEVQYAQLNKELKALRANELVLKQQLSKLRAKPLPATASVAGGTAESNNTSLDKTPQNGAEKTLLLNLEQAQLALDSGDTTEATKLFNLALNEAEDDKQRQQAIDGLLAVHQNHYDRIMNEGLHLHGAMWSLFEMQKLRPSTALRNDIIHLSRDTLARAEQLRDEGDLLATTDHLNTLLHISKMLSYEVSNEAGNQIETKDLYAKVKEVEAHSEYMERLSQRAEENLLSGSDFERSIVFWDYTKLAELGGEAVWQQSQFVEQFTQASLEHLNYLKNMNQTGEIKSRMDFIRYAFPTLMKDQRLYDFH